MIRKTGSNFGVPPQEERRSFRTLEKTYPIHEATIASLPCMNAVRTGGTATSAAPLAFPFAVAAWNLERCLFPEDTAAKLNLTRAPLVLLSEMDEGMARTAQKDPTAIVAHELGMTYAYGVEFLELSLGSEIERSSCVDDFNAKGFHGNALLASTVLREPFLFRLP